ncbi:hypothetical protein FRB90_010735 [Tulasnella sp. 427]|nr:hypothetical protein FRB90_010735 [Tulasnella sp. 427]
MSTSATPSPRARPQTPRYPNKKRVTYDPARTSSIKLWAGIKAAKPAATLVTQYHALVDAVKKIRKLNADMAVDLENLDRVTEKLTSGTGLENEDG